MKGKFIVIEGSDSSGKKTQADILVKKLKEMGKNVETIAFPTYSKSKLGIFVSKYLKGEFGSKEDISPEIGSMFFAIDRYQFKDQLKKMLDQGKIIVADRYTTSNIFQAAKIEGEEKFEVWEWIKKMESRIPQPDLIIYLDVPPEISAKLFKERDIKNELLKKGEKDIHEKDVEYQEKVRQTYLEIARREDNWIVIDCIKNGEFRSREDIHDEIFEKIKNLI